MLCCHHLEHLHTFAQGTPHFHFHWFPQVKEQVLHRLSGGSFIPLWTRLTAVLLLYLLNRNLPPWCPFILIWPLKPKLEGFLFQPVNLRYIKIAIILLASWPISSLLFSSPPICDVIVIMRSIWTKWGLFLTSIVFHLSACFVLFFLYWYYTFLLIMVLWFVSKFVKNSSSLLLLSKSCLYFSTLYWDEL